ncbi:hypothetical protein KDC22_04660 [Paenibacillus tritici]|uniref:hypothetical protein n=1 Tax=Paenibacillus tritici TaxID=1873425 RepID=UPI001BA74E20|nr:hypothetical protein [Paenibacillus tritici]QUL55846.1 hypothetical protein KDC22_04660 [Paenibacillus tritici]
MTRSRLFFNTSIIRQNLRQHGWIGILYTLVLLFVLPLQLFIKGDRLEEPVAMDNLFGLGIDIGVILIIFPIGAGLFLFRYLQSKRSSDLMHSLPLRRAHLLASHAASGLLLLLPPVWITAAVTALVRPLHGNMYIFQGAEVWEWCLTLSLLTLFLFVFTVFVGICTGQTILQGILIIILLLLPAGLLQFVNIHLGRYLYGYPDWSGLYDVQTKWTPILRAVDLPVAPLSLTEKWGYAILSALFLAGSFLLYRVRHSEQAGQALAFTYFNPLFKAGVMLCTMLLASTYFGSLKRQPGWIIGSVIAGGLIGYIVVEMILRKTWHIMTRRLVLEFAVYGVLMALLIYIPVSGLTGYENRVPQNDKVAEVFAGGNYRELTENQVGDTTRKEREDEVFSADRKYIEAVTALHHAVVTAKPDQKNDPWSEYPRSRNFTLVYRLESGRKLMRTYNVPIAGFEPELKTVMEHEEYKRDRYLLTRMNENIESFRLNNRNKTVVISDPQEVLEFTGLLKREILNKSFEDEISDQREKASIQIVYKPDSSRFQQNSYTYNWNPSYKEMTAWMEQKGYADKLRITAESVKSAQMFRDIHHSAIPLQMRYNADTRLQLARDEKRSVVITDKNLLDDILLHQRKFTRQEGKYVVVVEYKNGNNDFVSLDELEMTPALKALLP